MTLNLRARIPHTTEHKVIWILGVYTHVTIILAMPYSSLHHCQWFINSILQNRLHLDTHKKEFQHASSWRSRASFQLQCLLGFFNLVALKLVPRWKKTSMLLLDWLPIEFRGRLRDWLSHSHNKWRYNLQNFFLSLSFVVYKSPPLIMMNSSIWFWWNEPNLYTLLICTSPNKLVHSLKTSIYRASKSLISKELNWIKHNSCYQGYWPRAFITDHRLYHISHIFQLIDIFMWILPIRLSR